MKYATSCLRAILHHRLLSTSLLPQSSKPPPSLVWNIASSQLATPWSLSFPTWWRTKASMIFLIGKLDRTTSLFQSHEWFPCVGKTQLHIQAPGLTSAFLSNLVLCHWSPAHRASALLTFPTAPDLHPSFCPECAHPRPLCGWFLAIQFSGRMSLPQRDLPGPPVQPGHV